METVQYIVGVGDMHVSNADSDLLVTHALGSCLGVAVHDPVAHVGGLLHVMMPSSSINPEKAKILPYMFVDTAVPLLLRQMVSAGAKLRRLTIKVAGGAEMQGANAKQMSIGKRNYLMLKKVLWQHELLVAAEDVGGETARTMYFQIANGAVRLRSAGEEKNL